MDRYEKYFEPGELARMDEVNRKLDLDLWRRRQKQQEQEQAEQARQASQREAEQARQASQREAERARSWQDWFNEQDSEFVAEYDQTIAVPAHNELATDVTKGFDAVYKEIDELRDENKTLRAEL